MRYLFISGLFISTLYGMLVDIPLDDLNYRIEEVDGFEHIILKDRYTISPFTPGAPEISAFVCNYLIPRDQVLSEIEIIDEEWEELPGEFFIFPVQVYSSIETTSVFTPPDPQIYGSSEFFPDSPVVLSSCGSLRGYRICQVTIAPFKYSPHKRKLYVLKKLSLNVKTDYHPAGIAPKRVTPLGRSVLEKLVEDLVLNKRYIRNADFRPLTVVEENKDDIPATEFPSLLGAPVDLVVITDDNQAASFEAFLRFKKLLGINGVVKKVSWIRQHYNGVDDAEKIRNFIKDALIQWGVSFILLGGDTDLIPTRFIWIDRTVIYSSLLLPIASDLYFSDLDGNWNFDGDEKFGEVADSIDLYPDLFVGRLPTTSPDEVAAYLNKLHNYFFPSAVDYQTKALFFSSNLETNWPGLPYAYELAEHLPVHFTKSFLDETLGNLTSESLKDSIKAGAGVVVGIGHGDVNTMCIHYCWPRTFINNFYFDSLVNAPFYGLMFVVTCYTNPFQSDCLGEHWVLNPQGGGLAYIGPTSSSEGSLHKEYMKVLCDGLFNSDSTWYLHTALGRALAYAKIPYIGNAQNNNWSRVHQFSISLLGDPTVVLWNTSPVHLTGVTVSPETLQVGDDTLYFSFDPAVVPDHIEVIFYKEGETFIRDVIDPITLRCRVKTETPGYLKYTLLIDGYIPLIDSVYVAPAVPYLVYDGCTIIDTFSNGNGVLNPGEEIYLYVDFKNNGGNTATGVGVRLCCNDSFFTILNDTSSISDIAAGETAQNITPFYFVISDSMPDEHKFDFELLITYTGGMNSDSFQLVGLAPQLEHFKQEFIEANDTVTIIPYVANYGHYQADSVYGFISSNSDSIVVFDSTVVFPDVGVNQIVSSSPDLFAVHRVYPSCEVRLNFRIYRRQQEVINHDIILKTPEPVDSFETIGGGDKITLKWKPISSAAGYRIFRSLSQGGPYDFVGNRLETTSCYEDFNVQTGLEYYYFVRAVDSSMNEGSSSDSVCGALNPRYADGWPQTVYWCQFSSPNFADLDPFYPGLEIVVAGLDGDIYAWHCDGSPLNGSTPVIFDAGSEYIWSSPALGDVNQDGLIDIVFGIMRSSDNLYVISYNPVDSQATVLPGWPRSLNGNGLVSSPVLADIDQDGTLEIFAVSAFPAYLYAFHYDGSGVYEPQTGLLKALYGSLRGTPAVGDLDRDGTFEIICCGGKETDSLFVWDRYGNYFPPFPVAIEPSQEYSVVIGDILGDRKREICFYSGNPSNKLNLVDCNGDIVWQHQVLADYNELCPAFGDIDRDGTPEIIFCYNDGLDAGVLVLDSTGALLPGFPKRGHDAYPPVIADIDGDDDPELLCGSTEWNVYAYDQLANSTPGFPIKLGSRINSSPAVYDIDLDGTLELMISCYDLLFHVFDLPSSSFDWPRFHYDPYNSGTYKSGYYTGHYEFTEKQRSDFDFDLYPTLFSRSLNIYLNSDFRGKHAELKIYDVAGRLVKRIDVPDRFCTRIVWRGDDDLGRPAASGVYFVKFTDGEKTSIKKVVKLY